MSINSILILISIALLLGLVTRKWQRTNLVMAASIAVLFWLQPDTNLRHLGYWLPVISLALVLFTWAATVGPGHRRTPQTWHSLLLILAIVLLVSLIGHFDRQQITGLGNPPPLIRAVPLLALSLTLPLLLAFRRGDGMFWTWASLAILILLFILLKTPSLTLKLSSAWRSISGQSPGLATAREFQWLGYSYIAFRLLHVIRDKQAGRLPLIELNEFVAYTLFFPSLTAGPIARIHQVQPSSREFQFTFSEAFWSGSQRILSGLFKKFVLADSLAVFALNAQNAPQPLTTLGAWILIYAFSLQIYLDFSGYTDIAVGLALYLGVKLPENFNRPYLKPNLTQFWSNWHMTLTNWFRAYFFNPISRSLRKKKLPALAILLITQVSTMVLVGLWHGITVNFVLWGLWHGLGLLIQNRWSGWVKGYLPAAGEKPLLQKGLNALGVVLTFNYVTLGWVWFVLPTPQMAGDFLLRLMGVSS